MSAGRDGQGRLAVLCRVGSRYCALPVEHVEETMRPLPLEPLGGMPPFVLGVSIIRGAATPVVHAGRLLGGDEAEPPGRFLTLKLGERRVALAVATVIGVRDLATHALGDLPPLLGVAAAGVVSAIGTLDSTLLVLLGNARLVPPEAWPSIEPEALR